MKSNESKFPKCQAAWLLLKNCVHHRPLGGAVRPNGTPVEPPVLRLSPLDRITEHLRRLGLGQQVHVRFETAGGDFVLEDADGFVHAKDYDEAVRLIERIWLYQP